MSAERRENADLDLGYVESKLRRLLFDGGILYDPPLKVRRRTILRQCEPLRDLMVDSCKMWGRGDKSWASWRSDAS